MDLDDVNIAGVVFALIGFGIGVLVANSMGSGVVLRVVSGFICGIVCYFVGGAISDG